MHEDARPAQADRLADSVPEFCASTGIARSTLYKLWAEGDGPPVIKIGTRTLIPREPGREWFHSLAVTPKATEAA